MEQIIFICTGNTCRSPMAEGLFRAHNGEEKTGLTAASAGLYTENGLPASANAVAAAGERGADLSAHRSRQLTAEMAENAKYLVCMTGAHYDRLCELFPDCADKISRCCPRTFPTRSAAISPPTAVLPPRSTRACRPSSRT